MITYESSVTIARPPEAIWPYLVEREKQALWSDVPMTPLTSGPLGAGSRVRLTLGKGPLKTSLTLEMAPFEPGQRMGVPDRLAGRDRVGWGVPARGRGGPYDAEPVRHADLPGPVAAR